MDRERLKILLGLNENREEQPDNGTEEQPADSSSVDNILDFILENVEEIIKNYCNVEEIPEGLDIEQVLCAGYFGCSMTFKSHAGISRGHSFPVVNDLDKSFARVL